MIPSTKWAVLPVVLALTLAASEAWAARVAQPQGEQLTQGLVTGVHRVNGQLAFRVRTGGVNNQAVIAANQNGVVPAMQNARQFFVGPGTQFEAAQGMNVAPVSFAALRSGQRVIIQSQGPQAVRVRIFPRNQYAGLPRRAATVQGPMTLPSNYHIHNISRAGATHVKAAKR